MLTVTGGSTEVVGVVVELVKIGGRDCEMPNETCGHREMEICVELVAIGEGIETFSRKSLVIGTETEISTVT